MRTALVLIGCVVSALLAPNCALGTYWKSESKFDFRETIMIEQLVADSKAPAQQRIATLEKAIRTGLPNSDRSIQLGIAYLELGKLENAATAFREASRLAPESLVALTALATCLDATGKFDESLEVMEQILKIAPRSPQAWFGHAVALHRLRRFPEVETSAKAAIALDGKMYMAWSILGSARLCEGDLDGAIKAFDRALEIRPTYALGWLYRGSALYLRHDVAGALESARRSVHLNPQLLVTRHTLLAWLMDSHLWEEASRQAKAIIALQPKDALTWGILGVIDIGNCHTQEGIKNCAKALALGFQPSIEWNLSYATALTDTGNAADAEAILSKIGKDDTWLAPVLVCRAHLHLTQGRVSDCINELRRALEANPRDPYAWTQLSSPGRRENRRYGPV